MRVLVDTNVFVSYLLSSGNEGSAVQKVIEAVFSGVVTLLLPEELLGELLDVLTTRPYFIKRIPHQVAMEFIATLRQSAELLPAVPEGIPSILRDPKDDYLLAQAVVGRADYLVTGDDDLLSLGGVEQLTIVTPLQFVQLTHNGSQPGSQLS